MVTDYEKHLSIINDNDNVSKTSDMKEFLTLAIAGALIFAAIFLCFDLLSNIYITCMSPKQQVKIESFISPLVKKPLKVNDSKYEKKMAYAQYIKQKIVGADKNLQNRSNFGLFIVRDKSVNAFVEPDGNIYFTTGLLDETKDSEELSFVLAHELGHYAYRHHLKTVSRGVTLAALATIFTGGQNESLNGTIQNLVNITSIKYSQQQEIEADLYANNVIKQLYGENDGAIEFFKNIEKKSKYPEFLLLFSTHPLPKDRIKLIQSH